MPTLYRSDVAKGTAKIPYPDCSGDVVGHRASFSVPASVAAGDVIELCQLPAGCRLVDCFIDSDKLDAGTVAMLVDAGLISGDFGVADNARTCGTELFAASTVPQAGGVARPTLKTAYRIAPSNAPRGVGIKINTVANVPAVGIIGMTLLYAPE